MTEMLQPAAIGEPTQRLDGPAKVTGSASYAFEHPTRDATYLHAVQSTIGRGRIVSIDTTTAEALDGVIVVLTHENAPRLASTDDAELAVLQSDTVAFRGQFVAAVVAETPEVARHAAGLVEVVYDAQEHDVELGAERSDLYAPEQVNAGAETDTAAGDVEAALAAADVIIDQTYTTPHEHNVPMEPHTTVATWTDSDSGSADSPTLTLYDSTQGVHPVRMTMAPIFGLEPEQVRVIAPHVGGGFGSKGLPHAHNVLAAMAAQRCQGRPVKFAVTRQQSFAVTGYRTPTIQRIRLGATADGLLTAIRHDAISQTSTIKEFAEQSAVPSRTMYAAPNRRTTHRLAALDVPVPSWMRAPGECPGMFAPEVAMDELALACGLDPIALRVQNEPDVDPETGRPFSGRHLIECLREGAARFGWADRAAEPRSRLEDGWWVGVGVASSSYPALRMPGSVAAITYNADFTYTVQIGAADIGTGTWTALTQIAADALGIEVEQVRLEIGDTDLPMASVAGGSSGIASWGSAIVTAARTLREQHGADPAVGVRVESEAAKNPDAKKFAQHSFGAQFAEVRVHRDTGEIRVPRMLGVFDVGRVINPRTARSQLIGGMTMGLSMALYEHGVMDRRTGHVVNHDLAEYHIATNADIADLDAVWLDRPDPHVNPMGSRGIGEIGIVGAAAAVANAAHHATGVRVRDLPITPDALLS